MCIEDKEYSTISKAHINNIYQMFYCMQGSYMLSVYFFWYNLFQLLLLYASYCQADKFLIHQKNIIHISHPKKDIASSYNMYCRSPQK